MESLVDNIKVLIDTPEYQFVESVHTKKGTPLYVLKLKERVEDKFKLVNKRVDKRGGYYSGQQKGFVFKRILSKDELNEIFKNIFFEEKVESVPLDDKRDAWQYTVDELKNFQSSQREDGTFFFKYYDDGKQTSYSIKVPSGNSDDAVKMFAKQVIGIALLNGKYNEAVEKGEMTPERAVRIIKGLGSSLFEIEEDYGSVDERIRAVWNMKTSNKQEVLDKLRYPYLHERIDMLHLSDERYSQIVYEALESGKYRKLIDENLISANEAAFIIESAGFEIPEDILSEATYERHKEVEGLVGGYADAKSIFDIAEKHNVPVQEIIKQFKKGIRTEREHTKDKKRIGEIIKDHMVENPYYYSMILKAEEAMKDVIPSDYKNHDEYMKALEKSEKEKENYTAEDRANLIARPIVDRIKQLQKEIDAGKPEEVELFMRNEILNNFVLLFKNVVAENIFYTPVWLDLQDGYLSNEQKKEMLLFGIYNIAFYDKDDVVKFIDNVQNSEIIFGRHNKKLNNIFDLIPFTEEKVVSQEDFELSPKDNTLAMIFDRFTLKGKILSSLMGVYFSNDGAFASKTGLDIFIKGKRGYLKKLGIEEGVYGLSKEAKNIFPAYGVKKLPKLNDPKAVSFFNKYMGTYGNEKRNFEKGTAIFTHDDLIKIYHELKVVYKAKGFKRYFRRDIVGVNPSSQNTTQGKFKITDYPVLYVKQKDRLFTVNFDDMMSAVEASLMIGFDTVQIGLSEYGVYISESVNDFLNFEASGIRVGIKSKEEEMPHGMLFLNLNKKEFSTNYFVKKEEPKPASVEEVSVDDLKARLKVVNKMVEKNPQSEELKARARIIQKMIEKKQMKIGGDIDNSVVKKTYHFTLFFDVSALNISMADYDSVVADALTDPDNFRGYGNQFTLSDIETNINASVVITKKGTVVDKKGNFEMVKLEINIIQELEEENKIPTIQELETAIKNQLGRLEHYYKTDYDKGDIAHITLKNVVFNETMKSGGEIPNHILEDMKGTGYEIVSSHPHGNLHIIKLKKVADMNFDPKDFSRFKWVADNNPVNFNEDEFSVKAKFENGGDVDEMEKGGTLGDSSQFKVHSFNLSDVSVTNGMINGKEIKIGKYNGEKIELQDGTFLPTVMHQSYYTKDVVYSGWVFDLYPFSHIIIDSEYKGKKVVRIEQNYREEREPAVFENSQLASKSWIDVYVEGIKRPYTVQFNPKDYIIKVFCKKDYLELDKEFEYHNIEIKTIGRWDDIIRLSYSGGGYGEKYYVDSVGVDEDKFISRYLSPYLTREFKQWIKYGDNKDFGSLGANWMKVLGSTNNWEVEVEYERYEGYVVKDFKFKDSALAELNKELSSHISKFVGKTKIDWREIVIDKKMKEGGLFDDEMGIKKQEPIKASLPVNQQNKIALKKINVNNYVWYLDPIKMVVYENEDGTGSSMTVSRFTTQEREQVYDQMFHDKPMISHP